MPRKSIIGRRVRLRNDVVTQGGVCFRKGCIMLVADSTPHGLTLCCRVRGYHRMVRNVRRYEVEVVDDGRGDHEGSGRGDRDEGAEAVRCD